MSCDLYTIGHSTTPLQGFVALCRGAGIGLIADVRRFPVSRRNPQFTQERLQRSLPENGIVYEWLGESLGGYREDGYDAWMSSGAFDIGLAEIERLARDNVVAFMCAEGAPWKCHRRFVADALASRGHRVSHVLPNGELVTVQPRLGLADP